MFFVASGVILVVVVCLVFVVLCLVFLYSSCRRNLKFCRIAKNCPPLPFIRAACSSCSSHSLIQFFCNGLSCREFCAANGELLSFNGHHKISVVTSQQKQNWQCFCHGFHNLKTCHLKENMAHPPATTHSLILLL